jgi:hypothetical protein
LEKWEKRAENKKDTIHKLALAVKYFQITNQTKPKNYLKKWQRKRKIKEWLE